MYHGANHQTLSILSSYWWSQSQVFMGILQKKKKRLVELEGPPPPLLDQLYRPGVSSFQQKMQR